MLWLVLAACTDPNPGTAVGNPPAAPGELWLAARGVPDSITLDLADFDAEEATLTACEGEVETVEIGLTIDLLDGGEVAAALPAGAWCGLEVRPATVDAPLRLVGETAGGTHFEVALDPTLVPPDGRFVVGGNRLTVYLDLSAVIDASALEALGQSVVIAADEPLATQWTEAAEDAISVDVSTETDAGAAQSADAGCTCSSAPAPARMAWAAWALLFWSRRRRAPDGASVQASE